MVLSTALFDKPAFQNLICNGLVLAADGKKMSKRLKNYPPPTDVVNEYGADALRYKDLSHTFSTCSPLRAFFLSCLAACVLFEVLDPMNDI